LLEEATVIIEPRHQKPLQHYWPQACLSERLSELLIVHTIM